MYNPTEKENDIQLIWLALKKIECDKNKIVYFDSIEWGKKSWYNIDTTFVIYQDSSYEDFNNNISKLIKDLYLNKNYIINIKLKTF